MKSGSMHGNRGWAMKLGLGPAHQGRATTAKGTSRAGCALGLAMALALVGCASTNAGLPSTNGALGAGSLRSADADRVARPVPRDRGPGGPACEIARALDAERTPPGATALARKHFLEDASSFGAIETLAAVQPEASSASVAPWGDDVSGDDPRAVARLFGGSIDEAGGLRALSLSGLAEGGPRSAAPRSGEDRPLVRGSGFRL
jgi:hypothetical protein